MGQQYGVLASAALSVMMLAVPVLLWGAWRLAFRQGNRQKGMLMLAAALVVLGNVLIWTL